MALTVTLILGGTIALGFGREAVRAIFYVALGLLAAAALWVGVSLVLALVGLMVVVSLFSRGGRDTLTACRDALADGARQALPVGLACAVVGVVIGTMTLTGESEQSSEITSCPSDAIPSSPRWF